MADYSRLNDEQNLLLTQFAYQSEVIDDRYIGYSLEEIKREMTRTGGDSKTIAMLDNMISHGLGTLRVKDVGNDSVSGFGAVALTDDKGATGIIYRGTDGIKKESINDWVDNITAAAFGTSVQSEEAESFFLRNRDAGGNNYLFGHSKGGELSEDVYTRHYGEIQGMHLLNPQPINLFSLRPDQIAALQSDKVDVVIVEGDYVWFTGLQAVYNHVRIAKKVDGSNSHLFSAVSFKDGSIEEGSQPFWEYIAYAAISGLVVKAQMVGGAIGFIYKSARSVIDYVRYDLGKDVQQFIAKIASAVEKIASDLRDFAIGLKDFLADTVSRLRDFLDPVRYFAAQYAAQNPQIRVNTYNLGQYADRISRVNGRLSRLDTRINNLYWKCGLVGLFNLIRADFAIGYSRRLASCEDYLRKTAADFEAAERDIKSEL